MTLATPTLPLESTGYRCHGGPLDGATVYLSEHSTNSAMILTVAHGRNWHGRYVLKGKRLVWRNA